MSEKDRLIVVGNGMAGARAVEEILQRGGTDMFEITMFGDEPHGNYNRISLSNVLAGVEDPDAIFLNPLNWYEETRSRWTPASGSRTSIRRQGGEGRRRQGPPLRQAHHRNRQQLVLPSEPGLAR